MRRPLRPRLSRYTDLICGSTTENEGINAVCVPRETLEFSIQWPRGIESAEPVCV